MSTDIGILLVLNLVLAALGAWGFVDAALRRPEVFPAASRLTKPIWLAILAACTLEMLFYGCFHLLGMPAAVGIVLYQLDVRPAVRELRSGGW